MLTWTTLFYFSATVLIIVLLTEIRSLSKRSHS
jgi:hypothetical protein